METPEVKAQRLLDDLYNKLNGQSEKVPEDYHSINEWAKMMKRPRRSMEYTMKRALKLGIVDRKYFRIIVKGRFRKTAFYKHYDNNLRTKK